MSALTQALWVLLLGSLLGLELIGKVPPTLHTPLMSGANAISGTEPDTMPTSGPIGMA